MSSSSASTKRRRRRLTVAERAEVIRRLHARDPVGFARDVLGFHAWSKQREILEAVRDHPRVAVRACHGPGKTATAAQVVLWFLGSHRNSRVITTAPTWKQVEDLLWREVRAAVARSDGRLFPQPSATKLELDDQWFAIGLSTDVPERFQGHHADHLLLVVDEASGVDERIFEAAEGFLTAQGAKLLLLGNPTQLGGQFHRAFTTERKRWHCIKIAVGDTPNYTGEPVPPHVARALPRADWAAEKAEDWGEDSDIYRVRVAGEFPSGASNTVIPLAAVEAAQARSLPDFAYGHPGVIGVDVAREGGDESVIAVRIGERIRIRERFATNTVPELAGAVIRVELAVREETGAHPLIVVDDDGVGGGVTDLLRLRLPDHDVVAFKGGERARRHNVYKNRRSELWFTGAAAMADLDLDGDEQLAADLTAPRKSLDDRGHLIVERKVDTKKRLRRSPDRGDAVLLTLVGPGKVVLPDDDHNTPAASPEPHGDFEATAPRGSSLTGDLLDDPM